MNKLQARNEAIINAPISSIWALITDINQFHKINAGLIKATGTMNVLNERAYATLITRVKQVL